MFYRCVSGFWGLDNRRSGRLHFNEIVASRVFENSNMIQAFVLYLDLKTIMGHWNQVDGMCLKSSYFRAEEIG